MTTYPPHGVDAPAGRVRCWIGVIIGLALPTAVTWAHFVGAAGLSVGGKQAAYAAMQCVQFGFPVVWLLWVQRERLRLGWPRIAGTGLGLVSGLVVAVATWVLYDEWLRDTPLFAAVADTIREKTLSFGLVTVWRYAAFGAFYSLVHSLLEEYYWRWFVFGRLRRLVARWPAIWISAFGFMLHHVVLVGTYFGWYSWATLVLSLSVPVGGAFWAWLYDHTGSLLGPWLSHILVDVGIVLVGYDLVRSLLASAAL